VTVVLFQLQVKALAWTASRSGLQPTAAEFTHAGTAWLWRKKRDKIADQNYFKKCEFFYVRQLKARRYLGVIIDDELKWTDHINHVYKKTYKTL